MTTPAEAGVVICGYSKGSLAHKNKGGHYLS
jgi:hypothetical protein